MARALAPRLSVMASGKKSGAEARIRMMDVTTSRTAIVEVQTMEVNRFSSLVIYFLSLSFSVLSLEVILHQEVVVFVGWRVYFFASKSL